MPKFLSIVFTTLYLVAMLKPVEPILEYCFNYNYIVEVLCVNKEKPRLNCNGKCYLMKQLQKQSSENSPKKAQSIQLENYPIGFIEITEIIQPQQFNFTLKPTYFYFNNYYYLEGNIPFQPPQV
ncbi:hypothetical protein [Mesonia sp.]|uniref:hypothetical protein n=1 Tax=Mesonia sp. TaxID=1960830 RepID=UPI00175181C4|nr:hypothetical protein [Mesonia sp.]HIB36540.1 hypothetical protein [Mesonia sp.]HIO27266.1 hypothetical protein [Flavobacteriaceae bacterium]